MRRDENTFELFFYPVTKRFHFVIPIHSKRSTKNEILNSQLQKRFNVVFFIFCPNHRRRYPKNDFLFLKGEIYFRFFILLFSIKNMFCFCFLIFLSNSIQKSNSKCRRLKRNVIFH